MRDGSPEGAVISIGPNVVNSWVPINLPQLGWKRRKMWKKEGPFAAMEMKMESKTTFLLTGRDSALVGSRRKKAAWRRKNDSLSV